MTNPDPAEIGKSLKDLGDEEAIAIMEGRIPAEDRAGVDDAAHDVAQALLAEPTGDDHVASGEGKVVELFSRQPWMKMAAAMVFGVFVATLFDSPVLDSSDEDSGIASANVVFLEVYRSTSVSDPPVIRISDDEPWVTLIGYPDFTDADLLRIYIERAVGLGPENEWSPILEKVTSVGTQDSVVVNIQSGLLSTGLYRLRIESESNRNLVDSNRLEFRILR